MNNIKRARINKGYSQTDLAKKLKIARQSISKYENGDREPKLEMWKKLSDALDVSIPYLQGIQDDSTNKFINALWQLYRIDDTSSYSIASSYDHYSKVKKLNGISIDDYLDKDGYVSFPEMPPKEFKDDLFPIIGKVIDRVTSDYSYNDDFDWLSFNDWLDETDKENKTAEIIYSAFYDTIDDLLNGDFNKQFEKDYKDFIKVCDDTFMLSYDLKRVLSPDTKFAGTSKVRKLNELTKQIDEYIQVMEDTKKKISNIDLPKNNN